MILCILVSADDGHPLSCLLKNWQQMTFTRGVMTIGNISIYVLMGNMVIHQGLRVYHSCRRTQICCSYVFHINFLCFVSVHCRTYMCLWSLLARIQGHTLPLPLFLWGSLLTLVFGVLNLIVAVASWTLLQKGIMGGGDEPTR